METILIVEDHADTAVVIKTALELQGYDAIAVSNRNDAINFISADGIPNIIIMDWHMTGMSIDKFMAELHSLCDGRPLPRLILSTASTDADLVAKSLKITEVLRKPFDVMDPLSQVDSMKSNAHA